MTILLLLVAMIIGACVGSFCNVLIIRMHDGVSIGGRSHCMTCGKILAARHLIPIASWAWLRGRCAQCAAPIHWQYPVVEAVGALIGVMTVLASFRPDGMVLWGAALFAALFFFALLVLTATDLRWGTVPTDFAAGAAIFLGAWRACAALIAGNLFEAAWIVVAMGVCWGILAGLVAVTHGRMMGEGDPSVGLLLGAGLGWPLGVVSIVLAFVIGGACAAALLLAGRVRRKDTIPFVPFLACGALVAYLWHQPILQLLYDAFL